MTNDTPSLSNDDLDVSISADELVIRATIDRPESRNALNDAVFEGLLAVMEVADDGPCRVVVIRGRGGQFCSGGDLQDMNERETASVEERRENASGLATLYERMVSTSAPTVAAVEGYCLAGGCGLAAGCEFIVAAETATFGTPETHVGMFPMQAMAAIMPAVQEKQGLDMLFTGRHVSATEARDIGLVTRVFEPEAFDEELDALVDTLASSSPVMISMGKEAYYNQRDMSFERAYGYLKEMLVLLMESDAHREGVAAFVEDRDPDWKAR
ncbi:enoyl-CoA hydratase/isomerase family protein [Haloglomus litoreum]|uniref:enoyl-CoA hydratase/isomerase family protein n=1 Tax=Haloglomus litoreum TaxID=3034026 RepID=UPI0023E7C0B4|nr:enoyl-CoA hydratase-related protein [Haloglomus sp. DT116]